MKNNKQELDFIIKKCKENDSIYQTELFNIYYEKIKRIVNTYFKDPHTIDDVTQNIFIKLFNVINKFSGKGSFFGWVSRMTKNYCVDVIRSKKYNIEYCDYMVDEEYDIYDTDDENIRQEKIKDIKKLSEELSEKYGLVFKMYLIENMSHEEISKKLGVTIGTTKSNLHKAKKKIYNKLKNKKYE